MTKEKLASLQRYLVNLSDKLSSPAPKKQQHRMRQYHEFLQREIDMVKAKLEAAKLEGAPK